MSTGFDLLPLLYKDEGRVMRNLNVTYGQNRVKYCKLQMASVGSENWSNDSSLSYFDHDGWYLVDEKREFTKQEIDQLIRQCLRRANRFEDPDWIKQRIDQLFVFSESGKNQSEIKSLQAEQAEVFEGPPWLECPACTKRNGSLTQHPENFFCQLLRRPRKRRAILWRTRRGR